jgi:hypothetical protein
MPDYDFTCHTCETAFSLSYKSFSAYELSERHACLHCDSFNTVRRIGRVAITKGESGRLDALADKTTLAQLDENDPKAMKGFMNKLSRELGEDLKEEINVLAEPKDTD